MTHRVNVLLEDEVWEVLSKAPRGERSRIVNRALAEWFGERGRADAAERMDHLRRGLPPVSTEQVVEWIREDRERPE